MSTGPLSIAMLAEGVCSIAMLIERKIPKASNPRKVQSPPSKFMKDD